MSVGKQLGAGLLQGMMAAQIYVQRQAVQTSLLHVMSPHRPHSRKDQILAR